MELENLEKYLVTAQALAEILKKQPAVVEFMALAKEGKEPSINNSFCEELLTVSELNKFIATLPAYQEGGEL